MSWSDCYDLLNVGYKSKKAQATKTDPIGNFNSQPEKLPIHNEDYACDPVLHHSGRTGLSNWQVP